MTDKKLGSWDFTNFFKRLPEPTNAEKQAYALRRIFYKPPAQQQTKPQQLKVPLTEEEHNGIFFIGKKRTNITTFPLQKADDSRQPLPRSTPALSRSFFSLQNRIKTYTKILEKTLETEFQDFSRGINYADTTKIIINAAREETYISALATITFEHQGHNHTGLVLLPEITTTRMLYQVSNRSLDTVISAGIIYTTEHGEELLYEIKGMLMKEP